MTTTSTHHFLHSGDLYELVLRGHVITRITCFLDGSQMRVEYEYDSLPEAVKDKILERVEQALSNNE